MYVSIDVSRGNIITHEDQELHSLSFQLLADTLVEVTGPEDNIQAWMQRVGAVETDGMQHFKALAQEQINAQCREAIEAGFTYNEKHFKARFDPDQGNISLAAHKLTRNPAAIIPWETSDNELIFMDQTAFYGFSDAFDAHFLDKHTKVAQRKAQAQAATTKQELDELLALAW